MEKVPSLFELALLEILKRGVDVDDMEVALPRDIEKYVIAYSMCKTKELKYQLAMQHEHRYIADYYANIPHTYISAMDLAYLLTLTYQVENGLPYNEDLVSYMTTDPELKYEVVSAYLMELATREENIELFKRVYTGEIEKNRMDCAFSLLE